MVSGRTSYDEGLGFFIQNFDEAAVAVVAGTVLAIATRFIAFQGFMALGLSPPTAGFIGQLFIGIAGGIGLLLGIYLADIYGDGDKVVGNYITTFVGLVMFIGLIDFAAMELINRVNFIWLFALAQLPMFYASEIVAQDGVYK